MTTPVYFDAIGGTLDADLATGSTTAFCAALNGNAASGGLPGNPGIGSVANPSVVRLSFYTRDPATHAITNREDVLLTAGTGGQYALGQTGATILRAQNGTSQPAVKWPAGTLVSHGWSAEDTGLFLAVSNSLSELAATASTARQNLGVGQGYAARVPRLNVEDYGAKGDLQKFGSGGAFFTSGPTHYWRDTTNHPFTAGDVNKVLFVFYNDTILGGPPLCSVAQIKAVANSAGGGTFTDAQLDWNMGAGPAASPNGAYAFGTDDTAAVALARTDQVNKIAAGTMCEIYFPNADHILDPQNGSTGVTSLLTTNKADLYLAGADAQGTTIWSWDALTTQHDGAGSTTRVYTVSAVVNDQAHWQGRPTWGQQNAGFHPPGRVANLNFEGSGAPDYWYASVVGPAVYYDWDNSHWSNYAKPHQGSGIFQSQPTPFSIAGGNQSGWLEDTHLHSPCVSSNCTRGPKFVGQGTNSFQGTQIDRLYVRPLKTGQRGLIFECAVFPFTSVSAQGTTTIATGGTTPVSAGSVQVAHGALAGVATSGIFALTPAATGVTLYLSYTGITLGGVGVGDTFTGVATLAGSASGVTYVTSDPVTFGRNVLWQAAAGGGPPLINVGQNMTFSDTGTALDVTPNSNGIIVNQLNNATGIITIGGSYYSMLNRVPGGFTSSGTGNARCVLDFYQTRLDLEFSGPPAPIGLGSLSVPIPGRVGNQSSPITSITITPSLPSPLTSLWLYDGYPLSLQVGFTNPLLYFNQQQCFFVNGDIQIFNGTPVTISVRPEVPWGAATVASTYASCTGSSGGVITGTTFQVSGVTGTIQAGQRISGGGANMPAGAYVIGYDGVSTVTIGGGTLGGAITGAITFSSFECSATGSGIGTTTTFQVSAVTSVVSGTIAVGQRIVNANVPAGCYVAAWDGINTVTVAGGTLVANAVTGRVDFGNVANDWPAAATPLNSATAVALTSVDWHVGSGGYYDLVNVFGVSGLITGEGGNVAPASFAQVATKPPSYGFSSNEISTLYGSLDVDFTFGHYANQVLNFGLWTFGGWSNFAVASGIGTVTLAGSTSAPQGGTTWGIQGPSQFNGPMYAAGPLYLQTYNKGHHQLVINAYSSGLNAGSFYIWVDDSFATTVQGQRPRMFSVDYLGNLTALGGLRLGQGYAGPWPFTVDGLGNIVTTGSFTQSGSGLFQTTASNFDVDSLGDVTAAGTVIGHALQSSTTLTSDGSLVETDGSGGLVAQVLGIKTKTGVTANPYATYLGWASKQLAGQGVPHVAPEVGSPYPLSSAPWGKVWGALLANVSSSFTAHGWETSPANQHGAATVSPTAAAGPMIALVTAASGSAQAYVYGDKLYSIGSSGNPRKGIWYHARIYLNDSSYQTNIFCGLSDNFTNDLGQRGGFGTNNHIAVISGFLSGSQDTLWYLSVANGGGGNTIVSTGLGFTTQHVYDIWLFVAAGGGTVYAEVHDVTANTRGTAQTSSQIPAGSVALEAGVGLQTQNSSADTVRVADVYVESDT